MKARHCLVLCLLPGLTGAVQAQLAENFTVTSVPGQPARTDDSATVAEQCTPADLLMTQGCYSEAAAAYSRLIDQFALEKNQAGLDRACAGLYRAQLLAKTSGLYDDQMAKCRPDIIDPLLGKTDGEPMFITHPVFTPDPAWQESAVPGLDYKVTVRFDIDEFGRPENFDFNADDKNFLRYPVLQGLKNARYLPGIQDGKPVKKSKNVVEVIFCLDRGSTCEGNR